MTPKQLLLWGAGKVELAHTQIPPCEKGYKSSGIKKDPKTI
jgi:hypothetical protein